MRTRNGMREPEVHLITGGGGFAGLWLGRRLARDGHRVILVDVKKPADTLDDNMSFCQCDLTDNAALQPLLTGVDCVYHMAAYGMSGREQLNVKRTEAVNVGGTNNVIEGCIQQNVTRLVYTSTNNTVFGGQKIINGDETLPLFPINKHTDHYSRTKTIAEQMVLSANGRRTDGGKTLYSCSIRLPAIYGPGENRHIPRVLNVIERGIFFFIFSKNSVQEFLHVDNLAQAHQLAAEALTWRKGFVAAGQAYFISDDAPTNTFGFYKQLVEALGYDMPSLTLPFSVIYFLAFLTEWLHYIVSPVYDFQPLLTRTEVKKSGVTHYFSILKAREELGYSPLYQNDLTDTISHCKRSGFQRQNREAGSQYVQWLVKLVLMCVLGILLVCALPTM